MVDHSMRVRLDELSSVRIRCAACQTVFELAVTKLGEFFRFGECPGCKVEFSATPEEVPKMLKRFGDAMNDMAKLRAVEIEFPVAVNPKEVA